MLWTRATRKRPCAYLRAPVMHMTWPLNCSSKHITDAMVITNLHKEDMVGEHARCLYKLSQALYQDESRETEAEALLHEAEALYFSRSDDFCRSPTEKEYDALVHLRWR